MISCRFAVCCIILVLPARAARAVENEVHSLHTPPELVATYLEKLAGNDRSDWVIAQTRLSEIPEAEPYLRDALSKLTGNAAERVTETLQKLQQEIANRNLERCRKWLQEQRFDIVSDATTLPQGLLLGDRYGDLFLRAGTEQMLASRRLIKKPTRDFPTFPATIDVFTNMPSPRRKHGYDVTVEDSERVSLFVRAQKCTFGTIESHCSVSITRLDFVTSTKGDLELSSSLISHNHDLRLATCRRTLVFCDGDIVLDSSDPITLSETCIIANGKITAKKKVHCSESVIYAKNDISFPAGSQFRDTVKLISLAGVTTQVAGKDEKPLVEEKSQNPFPVRFFETADAGVECEYKNNTLTITKLTPGSALTKYGIKEGDVVTKLNDKVIASANDFRRELRYAIVLEAGIFHITRDKEKLTRVVYFKNGIEK